MIGKIYYPLSKRIDTSKGEDLAGILTTFAIANVIIWIGNIIYSLDSGKSLLDVNVIDLDLGIILFYVSLSNVINNPTMIGFVIFGWMVASIWAKRKYRRRSTEIIIKSVIYPLLILPALIILIFVNFIIGTLNFAIISIFVAVLIITIGISILVSLFAIPGIIIALFVKPPTKFKSYAYMKPRYLVLDEVHQLYKISHCPFRMKDKPGCAFLGYQAPNLPLICDYEETYLGCYIYSHLYKKLEMI